MNRFYQITVALLTLAFIFGGGWWLYRASSQTTLSTLEAGWTLSSGANETGDATAGDEPRTVPEGFVEYRNSAYNFSLFHPQGLAVKEYTEGGGAMTVTFDGGAQGESFQIYVLPYKESQVSEERFRKDVPSGVMQDPVEVLVDGVRANAFFSRHALLGDTREVWFIRSGYLYEVTTYKALDPWLAQIMGTWQFL